MPILVHFGASQEGRSRAKSVGWQGGWPTPNTTILDQIIGSKQTQAVWTSPEAGKRACILIYRLILSHINLV